jgi:hypothetical protein
MLNELRIRLFISSALKTESRIHSLINSKENAIALQVTEHVPFCGLPNRVRCLFKSRDLCVHLYRAFL